MGDGHCLAGAQAVHDDGSRGVTGAAESDSSLSDQSLRPHLSNFPVSAGMFEDVEVEALPVCCATNKATFFRGHTSESRSTKMDIVGERTETMDRFQDEEEDRTQ